MMESSLESAHSLVLNEIVYKQLAADKKRPLFLYEWLCYLDTHLHNTTKTEIKEIQSKIIQQLFSLFNAFPGPPIRHLIAKNMSTLFSIGDILALHQSIEKCNDLLRSKEHETQMQQMAKLCALNVIGALYEKLGRMAGTSYEETVQVLLKYMRSADSQVRIEIIQTFEKILFGLGTAGQSVHKDIYKQLKEMMSDRVLAVRVASVKCLCEMIKHSTFLYSAPSSSSGSSSLSLSSLASSSSGNSGGGGGSSSNNTSNLNSILNSSSSIAHELDTNVKLCFKSLDSSNYDVRCSVAIYLSQLIYYSINQLQQQQLQLQQHQQMANAAVLGTMGSGGSGGSGGASSSGGGIDGNAQQQRQQALQQQQNAAAQLMMNEKIKNTLSLLSNGFCKPSSSSTSVRFNYMKGAASSLAASAGSVVSGSGGGGGSGGNNNNSSGSPSVLSSGSKSGGGGGGSGGSGSLDDSNIGSGGGSSGSNSLNSSMNETMSHHHHQHHHNQSRASSVATATATSAAAAAAVASSGSVSQVNREIRIGVTYAYVELANLLGSSWLERNLKLYLTHVLNLVNNTKAVSTHLDAVYARKCVQFILRSIIGGMLNEKVQLQAARELVYIIEKCMNGADLRSNENEKTSKQNAASSGSNSSSGSGGGGGGGGTNSGNHSANLQHVLICSLYELSCILKCLNTSASILISDDASLRMVDRILSTLMYPNVAVKCVGAWCLRTLACSLPTLMTPLLDNCMDRLSLIRNPSDALLGYGYACAALLGAVHACPLGIPHLKPKIAFNIGEELLRTASQSNNITLALQKTSIGWLLLGAFMTMGSTIVRKHLPRMKKLWSLTMPSSVEQLESEKKRGDLFTWQLSLESRAGALASVHSFLINCNELLVSNETTTSSTQTTSNESSTSTENLIHSILTPIEGAILLLSQLPSIIKLNNNSVALKAQAATFRLKLYQTLIAMPTPQLYESHFAIILRELVAEFTLADQQSSSLVTSTLRSVCHSNDSILFANCWLQDSDFRAIEDQLQPHSASGCEALEHDVTYLYQKTTIFHPLSSSSSTSTALNSSLYPSVATMTLLNATSTNSSSLATSSSFYSIMANSNSIVCLAALPLGVAVIDASIQLYGIMYPKVPNKHRLQMLLHFTDCIQKQATSKANAASKQALQINIFTAVLGSLKSLAENKSELGDESIRKATLKLVMETLCHSNPILRCAAGEALGRMAQVVAESHFVVEVAQFCFEKLRNSKDVISRTGYALGLGCLHRYLGSMGAGQHMTSSISILFALAQNSSSSIVQVWAIHALYLITDSGGSMFRNYIEPCVEFIVQSVLSIPYTNRDVFVGLGKLLSSLITFMGPELQMSTPSSSDMRVACLTTCAVMQVHSDSMIRAEAIQCLQELHLFATKYLNLKTLVPYLINSLVSKDFLLRKVTVSCLRQLCQRDALDVCQIARSYVLETKPIGLISLIGDRGLECLLFKMLDIETNPYLIRDIHDILNSLLCTSLNESTLKQWLYLCKDISISSDESLSGTNNQANQSNQKLNKKKKKLKESKRGGDATVGATDENDDASSLQKPASASRFSQNDYDDDDLDDDEDYDDSEKFTTSTKQNDDFIISSSANSGKPGSYDHQIANTIKLKQITKIISPKWPNKVFAVELIRRIISMCASISGDDQQTQSTKVNNVDQFKYESLDSKFNEPTKTQKQMAHFDLSLAKKLKQQQQQQQQQQQSTNQKSKSKSDTTTTSPPLEENYLILFLQDLMRIACITATSSCDPLKLAGLDLLNDLICNFARVEEPNPEFKGHLILEQYQAQVSAALRPQFSIETSAHVTAKACQVCSMWISSGVARDLNDLRRVHQLLVSSLQKLTNTSSKSLAASSSTANGIASSQNPVPNSQILIPMTASINNDQLIYSELSLTVEKLAVLRAWAEVYIVAQKKMIEKAKSTKNLSKKQSTDPFNISGGGGSGGIGGGSESLLSLVQPELAILSYHWSVALKDYAFLSLPNEYSSQLPIEGGAFYHSDLVESSRPIYKEHFTKILLAYSIWLSEIKFEIQELPANQKLFSQIQTTESSSSSSSGDKSSNSGVFDSSNSSPPISEQKEKLFFMLLGLSLEHLSNTTGLAQLSDETIENILESIQFLLGTTIARTLLSNKSVCLCVEILSILYKVKLTRDSMSINLLVMQIVDELNQLRKSKTESILNSTSEQLSQEVNNDETTPRPNQTPTPTQTPTQKENNKNTKKEKNSTSFVFVILEICIRDLVKYLPNLLSNISGAKERGSSSLSVIDHTTSSGGGGSGGLSRAKSSFVYMNINSCKQLGSKDVDLLKCVLNALNELPFHPNLNLEKRISLISIVYHINFNLLQSIESLLNIKDAGAVAVELSSSDHHHRNNHNQQLELAMYELIFNSFRIICSSSSYSFKYKKYFLNDTTSQSRIQTDTGGNEPSVKLIQVQQSALMSTLNLKNVNACIIMKLIAIFFQYCSMKVFEPLNVYEKCKVFMCSMRCSDNRRELLCMIKSLNEILSNNETQRELRIVLLKEHLSYLLKLTSSTSSLIASAAAGSSGSGGIGTNVSNLQCANSHFLNKSSEEGVQLIKSLLDLLESMVNLMSQESKEQETLTIFIHILAMYLSDNNENTNSNLSKKYASELNDLVLKKLIFLGTNHKQEFKQILNRWPTIKTKIETAFKLSTTSGVTATSSQVSTLNTNTTSSTTSSSYNQQTSHQQQQLTQQTSNSSANSASIKAPKIQLKNFANFK